MSYTLTPYAVELATIRSTLGSRDRTLLAGLLGEFEDQLDEIDALGDGSEEEPEDDAKSVQGVNSFAESLPLIEDFLRSMLEAEDEEEQSGKEEESPPCALAADALRHLIMGEELDRRAGFKYAYVLECLCRHFGEELPHDNWCGVRSGSGWFQELDATLREAGVPPQTLSVCRHLVERGPPIPVPRHGDFPYVGYLTLTEIETALQALSAARIDDLGDEGEGDDETWLPEGLEDLRGWLRECVDSQRDLVCFYA